VDVGRWSWAATHFCRVAATEFSRGFEPTDRGFTHDGFQPTEFLPRSGNGILPWVSTHGPRSPTNHFPSRQRRLNTTLVM